MGHANGRSAKTLEDWRGEIDGIDLELLRLLNRRAGIAAEIAAIKAAAELPAYDAQREAQVLRRIAESSGGPFTAESLAAIFRSIIQETRRFGTERMLALGVSAVTGAGRQPERP